MGHKDVAAVSWMKSRRLSGTLDVSDDWSGKVDENELANLLAITTLRYETEAIPIFQEMYDNNSRILINVEKIAHVEINSEGNPGKFNMVNGEVRINDYNPPEMSEAAQQITQLINKKTTEQFQSPVPGELNDTPDSSVYLTLSNKHRLRFRIKEQDLHQLILSVGMKFEINYENASIVAVPSKRTQWNANCAILSANPNLIQCALTIVHLKLYVFKCTSDIDFIKRMSENGRELTVTALQTASVRVNANGHLRIEDYHLQAFDLPTQNDKKFSSRLIKWLNEVIKEKNA
ncbi:hypothetical protein ACTXT7_010084 [Hymenolepis weldensis]